MPGLVIMSDLLSILHFDNYQAGYHDGVALAKPVAPITFRTELLSFVPLYRFVWMSVIEDS